MTKGLQLLLQHIKLRLDWKHVGKWILLSSLVGFLIGSVAAFFLASLQWVTDYRETHLWILAALPFAGLIIGLAYHYKGGAANKGNNLLFEAYENPKLKIPFAMAPLVLFSTLLTHLFGGSAGREGTAVQIGAVIANQFHKRFQLHDADRRILIIMGISAGFAAVFGTAWAGAIFGIELIRKGSLNWKPIILSFLTAFIADYACSIWNIKHTHYSMLENIPVMSFKLLAYTLLAGVLFGLCAYLFVKCNAACTYLFNIIPFPPLRPFVGGIIIILLVWLIGSSKYIGLGIPSIVEAFNKPMANYDFLIKILFTSITLSAGFKGGEVTPLFFIGATLGNALFFFIPLPMTLLAAMGFIAVFAGATNTPIACTVMGVELFGAEAFVFFAIACFFAYLCSGSRGIYSAQALGEPKRSFLMLFAGNRTYRKRNKQQL